MIITKDEPFVNHKFRRN